MTDIFFKYQHTDEGFCRVHFTTKNKSNQTIYYCLVEDSHLNLVFYRCSKNGEPMCAARLRGKLLFEIPPDTTRLNKLVRAWIEENVTPIERVIS